MAKIKPDKLLAQLTFLLIVATSHTVVAQQRIFSETKRQPAVVINSWKTGNEAVNSERIRLKLTSELPRFQKTIVGKSGKRYALRVEYMPQWRLSLEHWQVSLYEETCKDNAWHIGRDLLRDTYHANSLDPRHIFVGLLYPETDDAKLQSDNGTAMFYPADTVRRINIEGFCVELKMTGLKFSKADPTRTDPMKVSIRFRGPCKL
jgi:hypothetical protein